MEEKRIISAPFTDETIRSLHAGDMVYISGTIYTARDAAHKRLCEMLDAGEPMPFDFEGQAVYYAGPCPAKPGQPIGSVGPTTGGRLLATPHSARLTRHDRQRLSFRRGYRRTQRAHWRLLRCHRWCCRPYGKSSKRSRSHRFRRARHRGYTPPPCRGTACNRSHRPRRKRYV